MDLPGLLARIDATRDIINQRRPLSATESARLREYLDVEWTYNSNSIEGSTLTRQETMVVLKHGLTVGGKPMVEHLEAINHQRAIDFVEQLANQSHPPTEHEILSIHQLVMQGIDDENAGQYRRRQVYISGSEYIPLSPEAVSGRMVEFCEWLALADDLHPVERAARAHFWLVDIHPFLDGNGRVARLLMNLILLQSGYPIAIVQMEDRLAYYNALESGHAGKLDDYLLLIAQAVDRTADLLLSVTE